MVESDPLRLVGYRSLLEGQHEIEVEALALEELGVRSDYDVVLLGAHSGREIFDLIGAARGARPEIRILLTGPSVDDETMLKAITAGAKGYIDESASAREFAEALQVVHRSSIWAPRRVLAMFVERATTERKGQDNITFTGRERDVLELLIAGRSNKEIGAALSIEERTVKAHVAKLMRKVGVPNRIALSVNAVTRSLLE